MKYGLIMSLNLAAVLAAHASPGPTPAAAAALIAPPMDNAYPGEIRLNVDASDVERHIVRVHESITGFKGDGVLLYPQWLPGDQPAATWSAAAVARPRPAASGRRDSVSRGLNRVLRFTPCTPRSAADP